MRFRFVADGTVSARAPGADERKTIHSTKGMNKRCVSARDCRRGPDGLIRLLVINVACGFCNPYRSDLYGALDVLLSEESL